MLTKQAAMAVAKSAINMANRGLSNDGWNSRVHFGELFQDVDGGWNVEVFHGECAWSENTVYPIDDNTDKEELAEQMKEDCAFIEGTDDDDDDYFDEDYDDWEDD